MTVGQMRSCLSGRSPCSALHFLNTQTHRARLLILLNAYESYRQGCQPITVGSENHQHIAQPGKVLFLGPPASHWADKSSSKLQEMVL